MCHIGNRLFRFGPESALLDQIEMISIDKTNSGTNAKVFVTFLLDIGTFEKRLFLYCFDIASSHTMVQLAACHLWLNSDHGGRMSDTPGTAP
jgi:hypothetical protein